MEPQPTKVTHEGSRPSWVVEDQYYPLIPTVSDAGCRLDLALGLSAILANHAEPFDKEGSIDCPTPAEKSRQQYMKISGSDISSHAMNLRPVIC